MFALRFHKRVSPASDLNSNASYIIVVPISALFKLLNQHIKPLSAYWILPIQTFEWNFREFLDYLFVL